MTPPETRRGWQLLYLAIVLLVVAAFLNSMRPVLTPFIMFLFLILLLAPIAGTRHHRILVVTFTLMITIWLLRTLGSLLAPFVLAIIISYILDPLVDRIEARGLRRLWAVVLLAVPLLALLTLGAIFGIPAIANQASDLIDNLPAAAERAVTWLDETRTRLQRLPLFQSEAVTRALDSFSPERMAEYIRERQDQIMSGLWGGVLGVRRGVSIALAVVGFLVLVPVLVVYTLLDFDTMKRRALSLVPVPQRARLVPFLQEYDALLSRYLRGQVLAGLIVGIMTWIGLLIVRFPYSGLVGAVAGVFNLVPYLGLVVSLLPALIIALLSGSIWLSLLKVGAVFLVVQLIDSTITGPRIVGGSVGLNPVWVILSLAVGAFFFGLVGLLLAMPAGVLIKLLLRETIQRYQSSAVYQEGLRAPDS